MKSLDQAIKIYECCVVAARKKKTLSYRDVLDFLGYASGVQGHAIRYGLELVWIACAHANLPLLTAIIVSKSTGEPNSDGFSVDDWRKDAQLVFEMESWPESGEIDWDYVWRNRAMLSDKHGTRGYWGVV
ncbi:MAG: hypothetical protein EBT06_09720 [Gammaproteobacteria bacterium]|nr:hypothetical protein [Gammaproteobacteria bacterium]NBT45182.1 hypothetical protein [Gammaproteobacteria bacterium]NBY21948.1 hypothetical protein [Gammaproteobacteria bacterium]NDE34328.1 hypothetical protein [Gammaproteobacteria bacterium]NDE56594.1 hypothetical protein [Gammaproteobacteria bacterium]